MSANVYKIKYSILIQIYLYVLIALYVYVLIYRLLV